MTSTRASSKTTTSNSTRSRNSTRIRASRVFDALLTSVVVAVIVAALVGPMWAERPELTVGPGYLAPDSDHLLGTDGLGRDVWQRLLAGGAGLIAIAALATAVALVLGACAGLLLASRSVAARIARVGLDVMLVIPAMLTMMVLVFGMGSGVTTMIAITCVASVPFVARFTNATASSILASDYVTAARAGGDSWPVVFVREVLPNLVAPLLADAGVRFIGAVYMVAAAGFLGFSPLGSDGDWATMVQSGLEGIGLNPWAALAPALAIAAVTIPTNLLADRAIASVIT